MKNYIKAIALLQHVRNLNAKTMDWARQDPKNRWAMTPVVDLQSFHERGIFTPNDFDLYELWATAYDMHKDVHGIKPRWWKKWNEFTIDELEKEISFLSDEIKSQENQEKERQEKIKQEKIAIKNKIAQAMKPTPAWTIGDLVSL